MLPKRSLSGALGVLLVLLPAWAFSGGAAQDRPVLPNEVQLIRAVTDQDADTYDFRGLVDVSGNLGAVRYYGGPRGTLDFSLRAINGAKAIPLLSQEGHDVVLLKGRGVDATRGGKVSLVFLRSVVDDDYREFHMEMLRAQGGSWDVVSCERTGRKRIDAIVIQRRSLPIIGRVGVGKLFVYFDHALVGTYSTGDLDSY